MPGSVITQAIMFIAVLGIATGLIVALNNYAHETESVFIEKGDQYNRVLQTNINIDNLYFENTTNTTYIYVKNTGRTVMKPDSLDVYIDGLRMPRDNNNRTIEVESDTDTVNTGKWDPDEIILIKVFLDLNSTISHDAMIVTPYNVRDTEIFSI